MRTGRLNVAGVCMGHLGSLFEEVRSQRPVDLALMAARSSDFSTTPVGGARAVDVAHFASRADRYASLQGLA